MSTNGHDRERLDRLRSFLDEEQTLIALERERGMLSIEILEGILMRLAAVEQRLDEVEAAVGDQ